MKINKADINVFVGNQNNIMPDRRTTLSPKNSKGSSLYAGNLNLTDNPIAQKRKEAMREAMKIVGDAFKGERKIDDDIERRRNNIDALKNEINNNQQEINKLDAYKKEMKDTLGITDDSQEQLDLELLEKRRDARKNPSIVLSDEEKQRLKIIDHVGMTEYQKYSLEMDSLKEPFTKVIDDSQNKINEENAVINAIQLERLKTHAMVDANVAADNILETASSEIIGMLIDEAKNHVEEKIEEQKETAEKIAEKKKEQEEKTEAIKENEEHLIDLNELKTDVQKEVQDIINKMKLLPEDIIGAAVDASV